MKQERHYSMGVILSGLLLMAGLCQAQDLDVLFHQVEALKIERQGYVLGRVLTPAQMEMATKNTLEADSPKLFKFQDQALTIVADRTTRRVLILYEQFKNASQARAKEVIGELVMGYDDPTIFVHDQVVYWAWGKEGQFTGAQFEAAKKSQTPLAILATVKFTSDIKIMDKTKAQEMGDLYYIISSDPLLKFFQGS